MKALIQRVTQASVTVDDQCIGTIDTGLLVLLGVEKHDDEALADRMVEKLIAYRVFADEAGKMNRSLKDINGGLLLVSQFTLAADTNKGLRPSFSSAAKPEMAKALYEYVAERIAAQGINCQTGEFAADMKVQLLNDGPVTFMLEL